jgi:flagellar protein FlgJ
MQQPQGLLATMSTMNGPAPREPGIWDMIGERVPFLRGLADPDTRARLAIGLEGLALNPNQALVGSLQGDIDRRAEDERIARTAAWLRSQPGGETFAAALEMGADSGGVFDAYMQSQQPANPMDAVALEMAQLQLEQMRQPSPGYRVLSPEETAALGLEGMWQQAPTGELEPLQADADLTTLQREYAQARQEGFTGDIIEYQMRLAEGRRDQTNVNVNTGSDAFSDETGKILAQEAAAIVEQGSAAQRSMGLLTTLQSQLDASPSGAAAALTQFAGNLGIATDNLDSLQTANAIISRLVPEQRAPGSGGMSDADLDLFKQSLPRLVNTPEGNRRIIQTLQAIAQYDIDRMNIARAQQLGEIDAREAFARYNALGNPLADFVTAGNQPAAQPTTNAAPRVLTYNSETGQLE